jgi:hypothetical protein
VLSAAAAAGDGRVRTVRLQPAAPVGGCCSDRGLAENKPQVPLAGDQHAVQALAPGAGDPAFRMAFARGGRTGVLMIRAPTAVNTASNAAGAVLDEEQHMQVAQEHGVDVEESTARMVFAWASGHAGQACPDRLGAGSMPTSWRICHTVDDASLHPRPVSSPWMRR